MRSRLIEHEAGEVIHGSDPNVLRQTSNIEANTSKVVFFLRSSFAHGCLMLGAVFVFVLQSIDYVMRLTGYDPSKCKRAEPDFSRE